MDLIQLLEVGGPIVLGLAGMWGTAWGVRYQARSAAEAEARRWQFEACSELLGIAYELASGIEDMEMEWRYGTSGRAGDPTSPQPSSGEVIDRAHRLAAACMVGGDAAIADAARELARSIDGQFASIQEEPGATRKFEQAMAGFESVVRRTMNREGTTWWWRVLGRRPHRENREVQP